MIKDFPCNSCGLCCQNIAMVDALQEYNDGKGVCIYLDENNQCSIYDDRPLICRIDQMFDQLYSQHFTKEEYYYQNALACLKLQKRAGLRKKDRIKFKKLLEVKFNE